MAPGPAPHGATAPAENSGAQSSSAVSSDAIQASKPLSTPSSRYPRGPQPAVLAVVPRDGAVLLVRRANDPDQGKWGFPGGRLELGETLAQAAERELREETGITAKALGQNPTAAFASLDVVDRDAVGAVRYHFVLTAVLCRWQEGIPTAGDDASECAWMTPEDIAALGPGGVSEHVLALARMALRIHRMIQ